MSVLITGGCGFIGSRVAETFTKNGVHVVSVDVAKPVSVNANVTYVKGDILNLEFVKRVFHKYNVGTVIHLVGLPAISDCESKPLLSFELNVQSVQSIIEAMRQSNTKRIIFSSSATIYGYSKQNPMTENTSPNPTNIYGYHKYVAEQVIRAYQNSFNIEAVIFRLFNVYGEESLRGGDVISIFLRSALKGNAITVKGGGKFRDFVHVDDIAGAFLSAFEKKVGSATINIGSGTKTTIMEVASLVKTAFPDIEVKEEADPDDCMGAYADISVAKRLLGFQPRESRKGIIDFVASSKKRSISMKQ